LTIDPRVALVLPFHKMTGQLAELARGDMRHGTVGLGVGHAVLDRDAGTAITLADARGPALREMLAERIAVRLPSAESLARAIATPEAGERIAYFRRELDVDRLSRILHNFATAYAARFALDEQRLPELARTHEVILEGAQGALLDPRSGFPPFITKTPATPSAAVEGLVGKGTRIGVLRAYAHRHGPGPLPTEDAALALPERHNLRNRWQGAFRTGHFDLVLARYAAVASGVDALAVTCLDRLAGAGDVRIVTSYAAPPREPWFDDAFAMEDERIVGVRRGDADVARVLAACRPGSELRLRGWDASICEARKLADVPSSARAFLEFLASRDGIGLPIAVVSLGPTHLQKLR
jgi:adenylosuccinate synthase